MNRLRSAAAALMLGFVALPGAAQGAEPLPTEASIRAQLDRGEWFEAAQQIDRLVDAHPAAGAAVRPDSVLDRLEGEFFATTSPRVGRILLDRAVADPTTADPVRYALLLASADETLGDDAAAEAVYRRLLAAPAAGPGRRLAAIGLARLLLIGRPQEALQVATDLIAVQPAPADRWEAELIAARAAGMLGRVDQTATFIEQASLHAWSAPVTDAAVARIALDRAAVAGLAGDRQSLIALSAVTGSGTQSRAGSQFMRLLPECGTQGINANDFVIVELVPRVSGYPRIELVHASRPQIAAPFFASVGRAPLREPLGQAATVLLRCATAPREGAPQAWDNPVVAWAAQRGIYPHVGFDEAVDLAALRDRLAALEALVGRDSPFLVPQLMQILDAGGALFSDQRPADVDRLLGEARRLGAILAAQHAPPDARLPDLLATTILTAWSVQQPRQAAIRAVRTAIETAAADPALTTETLLALADIPDESGMPSDLRMVLLAQALARLQRDSAGADPRTRGLAVQLIHLRRAAGDETGAAALQRDFGIAADLCAAAGTRPSYQSSEIRAEDYPPDAIVGNLRGRVGVDLSVDAHGGSHDVRVIMAEPPFVFDAAMAARAPTIRLEPAQVGGAARACRGQPQSVLWQLPS
jgi:hypothetical protein